MFSVLNVGEDQKYFQEHDASSEKMLNGLEMLQMAEIWHRNITANEILIIGNDVPLISGFLKAIRIPYVDDVDWGRERCLIEPDEVRSLFATDVCLLSSIHSDV